MREASLSLAIVALVNERSTGKAALVHARVRVVDAGVAIVYWLGDPK